VCPDRGSDEAFVIGDSLQFIEAIQMRDDRKLKHQGFFVNSGAVERVGERVHVVAAARARNKKKRNLPPEGEEAQTPAKAASKGTKKAVKKVCNAPVHNTAESVLYAVLACSPCRHLCTIPESL
jgi:hypothetical protein